MVQRLNNNKVLVLSAYLLINVLFIVKYCDRQRYFSLELLLLFYVLCFCLGTYLLNKFNSIINNYKYFNIFFYTGVLLFLVAQLIVVYSVDGESLNVDRWSALEVGVKSVLNLEYPYDKLDHMKGTSSNFPVLIYLGIPFYFLGDVGLLQPTVFIGIIFTLVKLKYTNTQKLTVFFLLLMSSAYLWEIFAKSDLMSNIFLVLIFIVLWDKKYKKNYFKKPILLSFLIALIFLTRGIVIIPLLVFLFKDFLKSNYRVKALFIVCFLLFVFLLSLPILISLPEIATLKENNPINNQTNQSPILIMVLVIIFSLLISLKLTEINQRIRWCFIIFSTMLFGLFFYSIYEYSLFQSIIKSAYDISYLGMILPFNIFFLTQKIK